MEKYMKHAIALASQADDKVKSNPKVGAVIVKDDHIIGEGYHQVFGSHHAEINAFLNSKDHVSGATMYVTLEPCSHNGKTPSCAQAIIDKGIKKVIVATLDPNPLVAGKGIKMLQDAGIEVEIGLLKEESDAMNQDFYHYITQKKPYVTLKMATTLDGKYATHIKDSKWITSVAVREDVHVERNKFQSILVGVNTIIEDDPSLTVRMHGQVIKTPLRIILDTHGKIPLHSKVLSDAYPTLVVTSFMPQDIVSHIETLNKEVVFVKDKDHHIDVEALLDMLYQRHIKSVFVEGGKTIHESFLTHRLAQQVITYIAPKFVGGPYALSTPFVDYMKDAITLKNVTYDIIDSHIKIKGEL